MRHPGIEPGAPRWQRGILPLNQWRFRCKNKNGVRSGIRTHAPEETGALNQRLRPLGHPNTAYVKSGSPGMDSNHRPRDRCCYLSNYSPPLYQLSYREVTTFIRTTHGGLAQSVECVVRNDEAPGSKPGFSTFVSVCSGTTTVTTTTSTSKRVPRPGVEPGSHG